MSNPTSKFILKAAVERSFRDPAYFLRFFLRHWFPAEIPPFHLGLLALITRKVEFLDDYPEAHDFLLTEFFYEPDPADPDAKPVPVFVMLDEHICMTRPKDNHNWILPRGFSKTTLCKGCYLYLSLIDSNSFVVFISSAGPHAETQVTDIKTELETNELIREAYGNQVPTRAEPEKWTSKELHLLSGAIIVARGRGGQVRGLTQQGRRPNRVCLDDIEDEESVATTAQRDKTLSWFYGSVVPAGQVMEGALGEVWAQESLQIINLGTLLAPECLMMSVARDDTFSTIRFGARLREGCMLWPYKMSEGLYLKKREQFKRVGKLAHFAKEYDSLIRVDEDAIFPSIFIYIPTSLSDLVARSLALDPAISEDSKADEAALVVAGRRHDGRLWLLDEWGGVGKSPSEKIEALFEYHARWQTHHNGIEAVAYQAALLHLVREEMARRQDFFVVTPIRHGSKQSKENRIVGTLSPRYKMGYLAHYRPLPKVESNLIDWPVGRKDFADAASMALNLLGETAMLAMENAMEDLPSFDLGPLPAALPQVGNYYLGDGYGNVSPAFNPRYGR